MGWLTNGIEERCSQALCTANPLNQWAPCRSLFGTSAERWQTAASRCHA